MCLGGLDQRRAGPGEVLHELLATLWAMTMSSGIDGLEVPLEALAAEMAAKVPQ